jgi:dolichol-phosphate mannosyltransferase
MATQVQSSQERPKLGVVVPLANEEHTIVELLARVLRQLAAGDRIFCVLDNASKDNTRSIIEDYARREARVVLVWSPNNRCVVDAYFSGYRAAFAEGREWILEMDGGFSHLPEEIPRFMAGMQQGFDYVGGSRFMQGGHHNSPWTRVVISKGGTVLARCLIKAKMSDMTSGFECFNRQAMGKVLEVGVESKANFFQTEIRLMMHQFRWMEVPITYRNSNYQVGRSSIREALRILWKLRHSQTRQNH